MKTAADAPQSFTRPKLSIVVPVFNEETLIVRVVERLSAVAHSVAPDHEIIFVNDGSRDATLERLQSARQTNPRIKILSFSRNFGHQCAITAGIDHAEGDAVVVIDGDLQDPPELIPKLWEEWRKGFQVVHAVRSERHGETLFKKLTASVFYRLLKGMTRVPISVDSGDFRLMDRRVVLALRTLRERNRFLRGLVNWAGFRQSSVSYVRDARSAGATKFTLSKMVRFAADAITSFSILPLQIATSIGLAASGFAFVMSVYVLYIHYFTGKTITGWTSTVLVGLFFGGVQLVFLGILGEYVGRIFEEVKKRPLYLLSSAEGFEDAGPLL